MVAGTPLAAAFPVGWPWWRILIVRVEVEGPVIANIEKSNLNYLMECNIVLILFILKHFHLANVFIALANIHLARTNFASFWLKVGAVFTWTSTAGHFNYKSDCMNKQILNHTPFHAAYKHSMFHSQMHRFPEPYRLFEDILPTVPSKYQLLKFL